MGNACSTFYTFANIKIDKGELPPSVPLFGVKIKLDGNYVMYSLSQAAGTS